MISENEAMEFLRNTEFVRIGTDAMEAEPFYERLSELYQELFLARYACVDLQQFGQAIHWFGNHRYKTGLTEDPISVMYYKFEKYEINNILWALLNNQTFNVGRIGDFSDEYREKEGFQKIPWTEFHPYCFDGELTALAMQGGIYKRWVDTVSKTKAMALKFCERLTEGRYDDFKIYSTWEIWTGYLMGFDVVYFLFDEGRSEVWILYKSDYD
jgi:hypothetical protein